MATTIVVVISLFVMNPGAFWSYKQARRRWEREKVADAKVLERGGLGGGKMTEAYEAGERKRQTRRRWERGGLEEEEDTNTEELEFGKRMKLFYHSGRMG